MDDIELAVQHWRDAGPLSAESTKLLIDLKDAAMTKQPEELIWAAFVRTLTEEQKAALMKLMSMVELDEAFRLF
jgi:hypothetical protein